MPRVINVIPGLSAAFSFSQAMEPKPDDLLVSEDVLSCGPLPPFHSFEQWARIRQEFWDSISEGHSQRYPGHARNILACESVLHEADSIVVWLGIGLADQIFLAWLTQLLEPSQVLARISVAQFTHFGPWNAEAWGLGLLKPEQFKSHPPIGELSAEVLSEFERYWKTITSADPAALVSLLSEHSVSLPYFHSGLQTFLRRYPDRRTGLGRWDYELLKQTRENSPRAVLVIGHTLGESYGADLVGDVFLYSRLLRLGDAGLAQPLVNISGDPASLRTCEVSLTAAGEAVLDGYANAVELNGIDEWLLGVHLSSKLGKVWYHEDGTLTPA